MAFYIRKKLVVVGDGASGKTSLLVTFAKGEFPIVYIPTVFDTYVADMEIDDKAVELALWDTAGQEVYDRLRPLSYPNVDVILIVFSIDSHDSLENVHEIWNPELNHFCGGVPKLLIGTKSDLRKNGAKSVTFEEGCRMAERIGAVRYMECSAMHNVCVGEVFETAARVALKKKRPRRCVTRKCVLM